MKTFPLLAAAAALVLASCADAPPSVEPVARPRVDRGALLYENHCTTCHTSVVHVQENHHAMSDGDVEGWVRRWSTDQKLGWSDEEVLDVTDYLLRTFYKF